MNWYDDYAAWLPSAIADGHTEVNDAFRAGWLANHCNKLRTDIAGYPVRVATEAERSHVEAVWRQYCALALLSAELVRALEGVVKVADRCTVEFDAARAALARSAAPKADPVFMDDGSSVYLTGHYTVAQLIDLILDERLETKGVRHETSPPHPD